MRSVMTKVVGMLEGIFTFGLLDTPAGTLLSVLLTLALPLLPQLVRRATRTRQAGSNRRIRETLSGVL